MSWTAPRTWVTGELVTAALGNAHWRDNLLALRAGGLAITSQAARDIFFGPARRNSRGWRLGSLVSSCKQRGLAQIRNGPQ